MNIKPIEHPAYRKSLRRTAKFILGILLAPIAMALIWAILVGLSVMFYWALSPLFN